ncbi:alpha/beta hydrolase [Nocardia stercoris]|uniref:Alpha/beta hydrolase n=2 Tax=Nocardia stercoris TaxID=2483361 RepID=A0A3M2L284_9NOCA|nr:alpha/beta hydrolase [Nocardia stercoris]
MWSTVKYGGLATAGVLGAMAGTHALRRLGSHVVWPASPDELADEDFALLERDPATTVTTSDGVRLNVRVCGPDRPKVTVIFAHGFCNAMESFHFQRRDLEPLWGARTRMVFYDQRGHGRSGLSPARNCTVGQLGRDLVDVVAQCAPRGPLVLVGHSMGGMAVLSAARQFPELFDARVRGVALLSTTAFGITSSGVTQLLRLPVADSLRFAVATSPELVQLSRETAKRILNPVLHASSFYGDVSPTLSRFTTAMIDSTPMETIAHFLQPLTVHDERAALPALAPLPALVLGGSHDLIIPFRNSRVLAEDLPDADLIRVTDAAHMVHLQYPELVNIALDRLLVRSGTAGRRRVANA